MIHPIFPALITAALCLLGPRGSPPWSTLAAVLAGVGLLNGCFDIQQSSLERPGADVANLIGAGLGFATGLALIFAIGILLAAECRKFPGFDHDWKPIICWALAVLALILAFVR